MPKSKSQAASAATKKKNAKSISVQRVGPNAAAIPAAMRSSRVADNGVTITVSHREFVTSLSGNSTPFLLLGNSAFVPGYDLNPANALVFPWLSEISRAYEKYRFNRVSFELVPRNPTTVSGSVYFGFDYDYDDAVAASVEELMVNRGAVSGDVWTPKQMALDMNRVNEDMPWRYVQSGLRNEGTGRMVYGGYLMVGIAGTSAAVTFDLFVTYEVRLSLPSIHSIITERSAVLPAAQVLLANTPAGFLVLPDPGPMAQRVPITETPISSLFYGATQAYRLANANSKGLLSFIGSFITTGDAPSTYAADTKTSAYIYDSNGTVLGTTLSGVAPVSVGKTSCDDPATWEVAGAKGYNLWNLSLATLRHIYPTAAYLVPYVVSTIGRTLAVTSQLTAKYTEL